MKWHYVSSERMTAMVGVKNGFITTTPPILNKFKGQPFDNLVRWLSKQPGFKMEEVGEEVPA